MATSAQKRPSPKAPVAKSARRQKCQAPMATTNGDNQWRRPMGTLGTFLNLMLKKGMGEYYNKKVYCKRKNVSLLTETVLETAGNK